MKNNDLIGRQCNRGHIIQVCNSGIGKYLGTYSECMPNCRISEYKKTEKDLLESDVQIRICAENEFCNRGKGCF